MLYKPILEKYLSEEIKKISPLSGGDINEVFKIETTANRFVVKINREKDFPKMLQKESVGLKLLAGAGVKTPKTIVCFTGSGHQFLVLEFIEEETGKNTFWKNFAKDLAALHQNTNTFFGLEYDNYIGSLKQINRPKTTWESFFIENRMVPLMEMAFNAHLLNRDHVKAFENFFLRIGNLLPKEKPSLIHGDLWSGNLMCGKGQIPYLIDPAIYYGNRETDIAMTQMFGGFNDEYLRFYNELFPLEKGWKERISIHNLYPNLVHLNLFGRSYLYGIERVINRF
jgi:fructosamine-3-kinase